LAQCALSLKRLSAGPGFNPQTRLNTLFQDYWRACFEINFSERQDGLMVSYDIVALYKYIHLFIYIYSGTGQNKTKENRTQGWKKLVFRRKSFNFFLIFSLSQFFKGFCVRRKPGTDFKT